MEINDASNLCGAVGVPEIGFLLSFIGSTMHSLHSNGTDKVDKLMNGIALLANAAFGTERVWNFFMIYICF